MENEIQPNIPSVQPFPQAPPVVPPSTNWSKILLFTALGLVVVSGSIFVGIQIGKIQVSNQKLSVSSTSKMANPTVLPKPTNPSIINGADNLIKRNYISSDGNYLFKVSIKSSQAVEYLTNQCDYSLSSKNGSRYDLTKIIKASKLSCSASQGMISSVFMGWISNNTFAIEEDQGNIKLVSLPELQVESYSYDSNKYSPETVSGSQQYWLFRKKTPPKDKSAFIILGKDKSVILDNLEFNQTENEHMLGSIYFDPLNKGFLFTIRNFYYIPNTSTQMTFVKFDFLDVTSMKLRNLLTTESIEARGMGCGGYDEIYSKPGEIIASINCITIGAKYLDSDRKIHIKL